MPVLCGGCLVLLTCTSGERVVPSRRLLLDQELDQPPRAVEYVARRLPDPICESDPSDCHIRSAGGVFMSMTSTRGGDMTSSTRVPQAEITGVYGYVLKKMSKKMLGEVPD